MPRIPESRPHRPARAGGPRVASTRLPGLALGSTLAILTPQLAGAYTWDYAPFIAAGARYETNPGYYSKESDRADDGYAATTDLRVDITGETPSSQLTFSPRMRTASYTGTDKASSQDYLDYFLPLAANWLRQTAVFNVTGGFSRTSTQNSEIRVADPNDPNAPGASGRIIFVEEYQERWYFYPAARFQITPLDTLSISLNLDDINYTDARLTGRSNYDVENAQVAWEHAIGPQTKVSLTGYASGFQAERPGTPVKNNSFSLGAYAGLDYAPWEEATAGISLGASTNDVDVKGLTFYAGLPCYDPAQNTFVTCELKTTENSFIGEIYYRQRAGRTITTEVSLQRSIQPSSDGAQVTLDSARAFISKQVTERLTGTFGVTYNKQKAVGADAAGALANRFSQDYFYLSAGIGWRLTRTMRLAFDYSYYDNKQTGGLTYTVVDHRLGFQVEYAGLGSR